MEESETIIVKFHSSGDPSDLSEKIRGLVGNDLAMVQQLFPGDQLDELACLFEVVLKGSASVESALSALQQDPQIEYAHRPSPRHPA